MVCIVVLVGYSESLILSWVTHGISLNDLVSKGGKDIGEKSKGQKSEGGMLNRPNFKRPKLPRACALAQGHSEASFGLFQDRELSGRRLQDVTVRFLDAFVVIVI
jgi:hypothetical protein